MLTFKSNEITSLNNYENNFEGSEKIKIDDCFRKIQIYLNHTHKINTTQNIISFQLQKDNHSCSYLRINPIAKEVCIVYKSFDEPKFYYYYVDKEESTIKEWKYILALIVIERWQEIKEVLNEYCEIRNRVTDLCDNFKL